MIVLEASVEFINVSALIPCLNAFYFLLRLETFPFFLVCQNPASAIYYWFLLS